MPYRPHLVSTTTRPTLRPLVQKVFGDFDPLRLDPYLLFDAQSSMLGTLEASTLDLDPSDSSTLDVITATRAGVATFTEPDGTIATAPSDTVRVDYTQGEQLTPTKFQRIGYTDFSQGWLEYNNNTSASDGGGYNGNPSKVIEALNAYGSYRYNLPTQDGVTYCQSVYIKRLAGSGDVRLTAYNSGGTATLDITALISSEFTRVSFVFQGRSGGGDVGIGVQDYGSGDMEVEIAMPQVEEGTTATDFVANTTGSPKFITGATYGPRVPMILVEPSSENIITRSEDFSFSGWTKLGASVANGISSPDGNNTAFKLTEDASASGHYLQETVTVSSATIYTASIFVKFESREWIRFTDAESINRVHFNTRTGQFGTVVGTVIAYSSTELDDGWHRITITSTSAGTGYSMRIILAESDNDVAYTGDGTSGIYVWGAQLETGSVATSYIPTSGGNAAARTRAADDLVISGSDFTDFYNQSEGTVYVESTGRGYFDNNTTFAFSDNSSANRIYARSTSNSGGLTVFSGGSVSASMGGLTVVANNVLSRSAHSFKANNFLTSRDGNSATPDTSGNMPVGMDRLYIGAGQTGGNQLNGHLKRLIYWPTHSDNL